VASKEFSIIDKNITFLTNHVLKVMIRNTGLNQLENNMFIMWYCKICMFEKKDQ